jgi:hypothetical protein
MYADYNYYSGTFKGNTIPESDFGAYAVKASGEIDCLTINRIKADSIIDAIKKATCLIAEVIYKQDIDDKKNIISSESVGTHKVTYNVAIKTEQQKKKEIYDAACKYLAFTGLLYRGTFNVQ